MIHDLEQLYIKHKNIPVEGRVAWLSIISSPLDKSHILEPRASEETRRPSGVILSELTDTNINKSVTPYN